MGRHGGRGGTNPPGSGTGAHPAVGAAQVPTEPIAASLHAPAATVEAVIALADEVCVHFARAAVARALTEHSTSEAEYNNLTARAEHWDALVNEQWSALVEAIQSVLPGTAQVQRFMPVRPLGNGHVELHVHDTSARRLVVLLTGAQALAVGAHLTANGAISLDRTGQKLDAGLPHVKAVPPLTDRPTGGAPPEPAGPPTVHP